MKSNLLACMLILVAFAIGCKKSKQGSKITSYTSDMGVTKTWTGYRKWYTPGGYDSLSYSDTALSITVINDSTISFMSYTVVFSGIDTALGRKRFSYASPFHEYYIYLDRYSGNDSFYFEYALDHHGYYDYDVRHTR